MTCGIKTAIQSGAATCRRMRHAGVLRDLVALLVAVAVLVVGVVLLGTVVACWRSGAAW